ncbi:alkaline shock response membrane anchor protein AmaP [Marinisporobacter balticus]|uniref:Putative alkaline shock family protein YloU n=1 Tax=Marinisporobacter balticus TaxID=2018667 RepID=A0A4R2KX87_9FIRM|nr:alkaline shock response membrane anchor protein AmaP [Marinisporobacter balticus]TCO79191.1 putative alkaline shock family protein YloU [Marinisporobacter balticus]
MKLVDRIFLWMYSFFIGIISFLFILVPINGKVYAWTSFYFEKYRMNAQNIVIPVLFFIVSMRFIFSGIKKQPVKSNSVIKHTEYGEVKISMEAIEGMAHKSAKVVHGLKDIKAIAHQENDGVVIHIKSFAFSDINIPEIATIIQKKVKEHIEQSTGVFVKEVKVTIDNIVLASKKRVE